MSSRNTLRWGMGAVLPMVLLALSGPVFAQEQREIGAEEERIRRPKKLEVPERVSIPIELPPEGELPPVAEGAPPITVVRVEVEGATLLPAAEAQRLTAPVVEKTVTLRELREVAQAITRWYRGKGYVTSRALVPAQAVDRGVVRLRVIEGKVGEVRFLALLALLSSAGVAFAAEGLRILEKDELPAVALQEHLPSEIVVKFKPGVSDLRARRLHGKHGASVLSHSKKGKFASSGFSMGRGPVLRSGSRWLF